MHMHMQNSNLQTSPVLAWDLVSCVHSLYTELLESSQPKHIRQFAAESFAYLVRKVSQIPVAPK